MSNRSVVVCAVLLAAGCSGAPGQSEETGTSTNQEVRGADSESTSPRGELPPVEDGPSRTSVEPAEHQPAVSGSGSSDSAANAGDPAAVAIEGALAAAAGDVANSEGGVAADGSGAVSNGSLSGAPPPARTGDPDPSAEVAQVMPVQATPASGVGVAVPEGSGAVGVPTAEAPPPTPVDGTPEEEDTPAVTMSRGSDPGLPSFEDLVPAESCATPTEELGTSDTAVAPIVINIRNVGESTFYLDWQNPWVRMDYMVDGREVVAYHRAEPLVDCSVMETTEEPCARAGSSVLTSFTLLSQNTLSSSGIGGTPYEVNYKCGSCQCAEPAPLPEGPFTVTICTYPELECAAGETDCSALTTTGPNVGAVVAGTPNCQSVQATSLDVDIDLKQ